MDLVAIPENVFFDTAAFEERCPITRLHTDVSICADRVFQHRLTRRSDSTIQNYQKDLAFHLRQEFPQIDQLLSPFQKTVLFHGRLHYLSLVMIEDSFNQDWPKVSARCFTCDLFLPVSFSLSAETIRTVGAVLSLS